MTQFLEKEKWEEVTELLHKDLWQINPDWLNAFHEDPYAFTTLLSYYKFASKTIARNQSILEINCKTGMGTCILSEFALSYTAIEASEESRKYLETNLKPPKFNFLSENEFMAQNPKPSFGSILQIHSTNMNSDLFFHAIDHHLINHGKALLGFSHLPGSRQKFETLQTKMKKTFELVTSFYFRNELMQCGDPNEGEFSFLLGCSKKEKSS